ncbi:MAG: hypothetical protein HOP12_10310 [Candidatus Eisenbacteria bacterium]|uniref:Rhomboid family intramembrane serine protease n=1 Tax=Eiseniibacteriota bacterium TaxID=2212470 RepID=A0A849ST41_UNCEI|nr:hypothetical protein [Candidatus Eisenbacteria bacterium]
MGAALLYLVAGGLVSGFTRDGTDNVAHAAGLGAGVIAGLLLGITPRLGGRGSDFVTRALAIVAVLALLASLGLAVRSGLSRG